MTGARDLVGVLRISDDPLPNAAADHIEELDRILAANRSEIATLRKALADIHNRDASGILDAVEEAVGNAVREIKQTCRAALQTGDKGLRNPRRLA